MAFRSLSGSKIIGQGTPQAVPIQLDPAPYVGAIAYGTDGRVYVSNGATWSDVGSGTPGIQGTQGTQGTQGVQGTYGPGFDVIGSVPDVDNGGDPQATLDTAFASATTGQAAIDEADDELWVYNGTDWVNVGSFRGVQGFQGVQGVQGPQGTIGEEGIQGSRGFRGFQGTQGVQGTTGIQGLQGIQGNQGTQGPQGVQGVQGVQGLLGNQGTQGPQSIQGIQGDTGIQGDLGFQGFSGDDAGHTIEYRIKDEIVQADPGTGEMIMNGAANPADTFNSVTKIWIDDEAFYSVNLDGLFTAIAAVGTTNKGIMKVTLRNNPDDYIIFQIQGATDRTGYWELDVTFVAGNGVKSDFVQLDTPTPGTTQRLPVLVAFNLSGDQGLQGIQGPQGVQGVQGVQGIQGPQGTQGAQAAQGIQGDTGFQGLQGQQGTQGVQGEIGLQGVQGIQGLQGNRGFQGSQGTQGHQGTQGFQGFQGVQGDVGTQGVQGHQGTQGYQGVQGAVGHYGGLTYEWDFANNVTASTSPGTNNWKLNDANVTNATVLTLDDIPLNNYSNDIDEVFDWLDTIPSGSGSKGIIVIESFDDGNGPAGHHQIVYEFTNFTWDGGGKNFGWFDVTYVGQYGLPNNSWDQDVIGSGHPPKTLINFVPRGEAGTQGAQGTLGIQGDFGPQGIQGVQGNQGVQGPQGTQGVQGTEGARDFNVTNLSSIAYVIDGVNNPDLKLLRGFTYRFNIAAPGHPFYIKTNPSTGTADQYNTGVTGNGTAGGTILFRVPANAPDTLYYQCSLHAGMGGELQISDIGPQGTQGLQGLQGTDGLQGFGGFQGSTGAGTQGLQGFQGDFGFQGTQGFPGPIGPQGIQGNLGIQGGGGFQGSTGGFGGVTFDYTHSTDTAASDPGVGYLKFNASSLASATIMYMDDRDDNFTDIQPFLRTIDDSTSPVKGHFKVSLKSAPESFAIFTIASLTESSGYFAITSSFVSGSVSAFANDADVIITFARTGDIGPIGPQGVQGFDGFQGSPGLQGGGGGQGTQGSQGTSIQGVQGNQGTSGFVGGDGIQGAQGLQGVQGRSIQGAEGADGEGFQGVQGLQGLTGSGAQGIQGDSGAQGIAGIGATGIQGFQGIQGVSNQGVQGNQGTVGPAGFGNQGTQGFQGPQGTDGDLGAQGLQGPGGTGDTGGQGIQGLDGDDGSQGAQGLTGDGNQGTQGFQGAAGIGATGVQGFTGIQGIQGIIGESGVGGTQGVQGFTGIQGFQGIDGGLGDTGGQGVQGIPGGPGVQGETGAGTQGLQGAQGIQGDLGVQGFPGQGTQGIQGTQAAQGIQGERGFQGTQGAQGFGPEGGVKNLQNVHESAAQDTALFIPFFEGGAEHRPLLATTGPNPGGESNFFYTNDADELTVENIQVEGNINVVGTVTADTLTQTGTTAFHFNTDQPITMGGTTGTPFSKIEYNSTQNALVMQGYGSNLNQIEFRSPTATIFDFDMSTGEFTASGDISANSDQRLKDNIETVTNALEKVDSLRGVFFEMKENPGKRKLGLIAQEVEEVLPEVVKTAKDGEQIKSVAYANIVGLLVQAIKELKIEVDDLKGR